jgi:hypothetical protein
MPRNVDKLNARTGLEKREESLAPLLSSHARVQLINIGVERRAALRSPRFAVMISRAPRSRGG